ncbi:MAG: hypothetical protein V1858_02505 [Candidatus Gottesmanbacteria bacterium]
MTATTHSLVGVSLGRLIPNPIVALTVVFLSNFILDAVPHWDTGTGWHNRPKKITFIMSAVDVSLGLVLAWVFFHSKLNPLYLFSLVFASTLADWTEAPYIFLNWNFPPFNWFYKIQSKYHARNGSLWGIVTQLVIVIPLVLVAYYL